MSIRENVNLQYAFNTLLINGIYERINKLSERKGWKTGRERGQKGTERDRQNLTLEIPNKSTKRSVIF